MLTREMIEAGEDVLLCELGGAVSSHWSAPDLARKVFEAMTAAAGTPQGTITTYHGGTIEVEGDYVIHPATTWRW